MPRGALVALVPNSAAPTNAWGRMTLASPFLLSLSVVLNLAPPTEPLSSCSCSTGSSSRFPHLEFDSGMSPMIPALLASQDTFVLVHGFLLGLRPLYSLAALSFWGPSPSFDSCFAGGMGLVFMGLNAGWAGQEGRVRCMESGAWGVGVNTSLRQLLLAQHLNVCFLKPRATEGCPPLGTGVSQTAVRGGLCGSCCPSQPSRGWGLDRSTSYTSPTSVSGQ